MNLSPYAATALVNALLRNVPYTSPTTVYVGLHTADPGPDGLTAEVTPGANTYVRQPASFGVPDANSVTTISAALTWVDMPNVTVTHVSLWDASSAGSMLAAGALLSAVYVAAGEPFEIAASALTFALA